MRCVIAEKVHAHARRRCMYHTARPEGVPSALRPYDRVKGGKIILECSGGASWAGACNGSCSSPRLWRHLYGIELRLKALAETLAGQSEGINRGEYRGETARLYVTRQMHNATVTHRSRVASRAQLLQLLLSGLQCVLVAGRKLGAQVSVMLSTPCLDEQMGSLVLKR